MNPDPISPIKVEAVPAPAIQSQETDPSIPAVTTFQEDLSTANQRKVNLILEYTQAVIAGMVVAANMVVGVYAGIVHADKRPEFPIVLSSALFLVVGYYFSRTVNQAANGNGKMRQFYTGR